MILSIFVQNMLQSRFRKYSKVPLRNSMSGADVARKMLQENGIYDVNVMCIPGQLTDHYNPATKTVNLSEAVYNGRSVAAAAVAAHECGHVVQHQVGYAPLKLRTALVPVVSIANNTVQWILLAGILMVNVFPTLLWVGIALFAMTTLFSFVTLPVEINASARAVNWLENAGITDYGPGPSGQIGHHEVEREYPCGDVYPEVRYGGGPHLGEDHIVDDQHDDGHDEVPAESQDGVPVASEQVLGYQGPEDVPRFVDLAEILPETVPPFDRNDAAVAVCHYGSSSSRGS